jgi:DNA-binding PadR family transcriptional regulator
VLSACGSADFLYLHRATGLNLGNLSVHLTKLEAAGFITIEKTFANNRPLTTVQLTTGGWEAFEEYWRRLDETRKSLADWKKKQEAEVRLKLVPVKQE